MRLACGFFLSLLLTAVLPAQPVDTIKYNWPLAPMGNQREISGAFGEYRDTDAAGHYHNGTDVPAPAGTPVLAVLPGVVAVAYDDGSTGYDSYVRVTSTINGQPKNITYYHTRPVVTVGQSVTVGQQISTIAIDHVHLIDYKSGSTLTGAQLNAIRPDGGLTPYVDTWKPRIRFVRFFLDNTDLQLSPLLLGDKVDIVVHVEEANGTSASATNNGTYEIGYKILSADSQTVMYNPPDNGARFRYYNIPGDAYVNINYYRPLSSTSMHVYNVTNGAGAAAAASTQVVANNSWNTTAMPFGNYVVMVYTKDTRGNADTLFIPVTTNPIDLTPPAAPRLLSVLRDSSNFFTLRWAEPADSDHYGYRLYYSTTGVNYLLRDNDTVLLRGMTARQYSYSVGNPLYLRLHAVDNAPLQNVSQQSRVYPIKFMNDGKKVLLVDGFNRYGGSGSWAQPYHDFLIRYAEVIPSGVDACHNSLITSGTVSLLNYDLVIWMLGDESTADETFSAAEQARVKQYLEAGGKLFVSGSEIAWDLSGASSASSSDRQFLKDYLKAVYTADDAAVVSVTGAVATPFAGQNFAFGQTGSGSPYTEDYPDVIDTTGGSRPLLFYSASAVAAVGYTGTFGAGTLPGRVVYMAFPFETINTKAARQQVLNSVFTYFGYPVSVQEPQEVPAGFTLGQNYPNPFNPSTIIPFTLANPGTVSVTVFNALGSEVWRFNCGMLPSGSHSVPFFAAGIPAGVYFYQVSTQGISLVKKMLYLK